MIRHYSDQVFTLDRDAGTSNDGVRGFHVWVEEYRCGHERTHKIVKSVVGYCRIHTRSHVRILVRDYLRYSIKLNFPFYLAVMQIT